MSPMEIFAVACVWFLAESVFSLLDSAKVWRFLLAIVLLEFFWSDR